MNYIIFRKEEFKVAVNNYKKDEENTKFSWKNILRMLEFVKPYKKDLIIAIIIGILANILLLFIPKIITYAIDVYLVQKYFLGIIFLTTLMLAIIIISLSLTRVRRDKISIILNKVTSDVKLALFTKVP